jgi:predicted DNA-binding transcriptional regulator YafY
MNQSKRKWKIRWDLLLRYRLIEIIALWEGRLTTNHLCETFGIGRQQASKDINAYLDEIGSGNLEYDKQLKGYKPTSTFKPKVTSGLADEYLHLQHRNNELSNTFESLSLQIANTEVLAVPMRHIRPEIIRPIVTAARQKRRLDVDYVSIQHPNREGRVIAPHTLVYTGLRWHVRAWCEKNSEYRDFVLSRFRGVPETMDSSAHHETEDHDWNTMITLKIKPDERLSPVQRKVVSEDYGMSRGILSIKLRATLVQYALQQLGIETEKVEKTPEAQQIVVANQEQIAEWLFDG